MDITKCSGHNCPWKTDCRRFTEPPDPLNQSWFVEAPGHYRVIANYPLIMNDDGSFPIEEGTEWECEFYMRGEQ